MKPQDHQTERSERGRPEERRRTKSQDRGATSKSCRDKHRRPLLLLRDSKTAQAHRPVALRTTQRGLTEFQTPSGKPCQILAQQEVQILDSSCGCHQPNCGFEHKCLECGVDHRWVDTAETVMGITVTAKFRLPERVKDSGESA